MTIFAAKWSCIFCLAEFGNLEGSQARSGPNDCLTRNKLQAGCNPRTTVSDPLRAIQVLDLDG